MKPKKYSFEELSNLILENDNTVSFTEGWSMRICIPKDFIKDPYSVYNLKFFKKLWTESDDEFFIDFICLGESPIFSVFHKHIETVILNDDGSIKHFDLILISHRFSGFGFSRRFFEEESKSINKKQMYFYKKDNVSTHYLKTLLQKFPKAEGYLYEKQRKQDSEKLSTMNDELRRRKESNKNLFNGTDGLLIGIGINFVIFINSDYKFYIFVAMSTWFILYKVKQILEYILEDREIKKMEEQLLEEKVRLFGRLGSVFYDLDNNDFRKVIKSIYQKYNLDKKENDRYHKEIILDPINFKRLSTDEDHDEPVLEIKIFEEKTYVSLNTNWSCERTEYSYQISNWIFKNKEITKSKENKNSK